MLQYFFVVCVWFCVCVCVHYDLNVITNAKQLIGPMPREQPFGSPTRRGVYDCARRRDESAADDNDDGAERRAMLLVAKNYREHTSRECASAIEGTFPNCE